MRIKAKLTPKQVTKVKLMTFATVSMLSINIMTQLLAQSMADEAENLPPTTKEMKSYDGKYIWHNEPYAEYARFDQSAGYIEEFTNNSAGFCHSNIIITGASLMGNAFLGTAYLLILLYLFLGIAIVADIFMEAIEVITSQKTVVTVPDPENDGKFVEIERDVWNPTIANLTLMALGSSAPEILLSVFSTTSDLDGLPSPLGPAGIVGSAAFNLLVITAICIVAVDKPKEIFDTRVYAVTAVVSTWAYVWFVLVLTVWSPDEVEIWEAVMTIVFFILLVIIAFGADRMTAGKIFESEAAEKLGTSLPDAFASKTAATQAKYADAAVGNVTGSNAVNVFLGMGIPWCIAAFYWNGAHDGANAPVPAGALAFSVIVFLCCSMVCFAVLFLRRVCVGGELGGPKVTKYVSAGILVCLWLTFVILVSLKAYGVIAVEE